MQFLYTLRALRTPFLEKAAQLITFLGEDTAFLLIGLVLLWCVSRRWGWRLLMTGMTGTALGMGLKTVFRVPRPWVRDPEFPIVESARKMAGGYSFPSGHTQSSAHVFGTLAAAVRRRWSIPLALLGVALVAFSRMLLGVHTPADVCAGAALGLVMVTAEGLLTRAAEKGPKARLWVGAVQILLILACLLFAVLAPATEKSDPVCDRDCAKVCATLLGSALGLFPAWMLTEKRNPYDPKAVWWVQLIKLAGGVAVIMALRLGLKPVLHALFGDALFCEVIRYTAIAFAGGYLWPLVFPALNRLAARKAARA